MNSVPLAASRPSVVDHDDPRMLELGGDPRLREEALLVGLGSSPPPPA